MEKYIPHIILPALSINATYMQHCISSKRLEALCSAYAALELSREFRYYKWKCKHPILRRIPFVKEYIRKKMGL